MSEHTEAATTCTVITDASQDIDTAPRCGKPAVKRLPGDLDFPVCQEHADLFSPDSGSPEVESVEVVRTVLDENRCGAHGLGPKLAPWCVLPRGHAGPHSGRSTDDG